MNIWYIVCRTYSVLKDLLYWNSLRLSTHRRSWPSVALFKPQSANLRKFAQTQYHSPSVCVCVSPLSQAVKADRSPYEHFAEALPIPGSSASRSRCYSNWKAGQPTNPSYLPNSKFSHFQFFLSQKFCFGRPEIRQQILQHCSACTRADVALNNLVVRSRTPSQCQRTFWTIPSVISCHLKRLQEYEGDSEKSWGEA